MTNALTIKNVSHWFGDNRVLEDINLKIAAGQVVALVGPSGCGKSTLLRAILGTHPPKEGQITTGEHPVTGPTRDVGIVYQHYSLYPFLTAEQNVAFGLLLDETNLFFRTILFWKWFPLKKVQLKKSRDWLEKLNLGAAAKLYPHEMSGGMRQRVAIAQALIMKPKVVLLDEPFGALDEATREELQLMLLHLYQENQQAKKDGKEPPYTILIVTHELNEAFYVADRILGLSQYHAGNETNGTFKKKMGARIIYDKSCPVFGPDDPRDFGIFLKQREELRKYVFDPNVLQQDEEHVTFGRKSRC